MVTTLRTSPKNSVRELTDYTTYVHTYVRTDVDIYIHKTLEGVIQVRTYMLNNLTHEKLQGIVVTNVHDAGGTVYVGGTVGHKEHYTGTETEQVNQPIGWYT